MKTICKKDIQAMQKMFGLTESELRYVELFSDSVNAAKRDSGRQSYFEHALLTLSALIDEADAAVKAILIYTGAKIQKENEGLAGWYKDTSRAMARKLKCNVCSLEDWLVELSCPADPFEKFRGHVCCKPWEDTLYIA